MTLHSLFHPQAVFLPRVLHLLLLPPLCVKVVFLAIAPDPFFLVREYSSLSFPPSLTKLFFSPFSRVISFPLPPSHVNCEVFHSAFSWLESTFQGLLPHYLPRSFGNTSLFFAGVEGVPPHFNYQGRHP